MARSRDLTKEVCTQRESGSTPWPGQSENEHHKQMQLSLNGNEKRPVSRKPRTLRLLPAIQWENSFPFAICLLSKMPETGCGRMTLSFPKAWALWLDSTMVINSLQLWEIPEVQEDAIPSPEIVLWLNPLKSHPYFAETILNKGLIFMNSTSFSSGLLPRAPKAKRARNMNSLVSSVWHMHISLLKQLSPLLTCWIRIGMQSLLSPAVVLYHDRWRDWRPLGPTSLLNSHWFGRGRETAADQPLHPPSFFKKNVLFLFSKCQVNSGPLPETFGSHERKTNNRELT